ncbi:MAG: carbohydrate ABC transporter permease [Clostridia bacterium]|nr:carbohydrate ABC transporter permease [Clostridia bacterium]MDE6355731.1 carbohydrate ABC transporter permease [Clostridia bacterium]MDE7215159.1 carbohydrate ABC transporter permease [Clostridia bacterium]
MKKQNVIPVEYTLLRRKRVKGDKIAKDVVYYVCGIILSLLFLFPLVYMLATSTKSESAYVADAGSLAMFLPDFANLGTMFNNYGKVFTDYGIWRYALNSFLYAAIVIVLNVLINGLAGYVMAKLRFPGKKLLSFMIIFLIVVPVETSIIPLYSIVKTMLGLKGVMSVAGVVLPAAISIFNIFLFIQFFEGIPKEYEEAARIDGASTMGIFFKIILPLSKPIIATVAVFCFIGVWNDYLWPTMILPYPGEGEWPLYPIQSALNTIQSIRGITTGEVMASLVVTSIPIFVIYVAAQKYIVQGFGSAGLKM